MLTAERRPTRSGTYLRARRSSGSRRLGPSCWKYKKGRARSKWSSRTLIAFVKVSPAHCSRWLAGADSRTHPALNHPLSTYTPACQHCGLILCTLHPVYAPCPSCHNPLLSPAQLARVLLRVQQDIDAQLTIEQAERDAVERERQQRLIAESGGGAFPTLGGGPARPTPVPAALPAQERRVLTLGAKGKGKGKTTLTTTTIRPVSTPSPRPDTPPPDDIYPRPRSPPFDIVRVAKDLNKVLQWRAEEDRPWGNMKEKDKNRLEYQELPISHFIEEHAVGRRKAAKQKKAEGKGVDGRVVPGAAV